MLAPHDPRPRFKLGIPGLLIGEAEGTLGTLCLAAVLIVFTLLSPAVTNRVWSAFGWSASITGSPAVSSHPSAPVPTGNLPRP